MVMVVVERGAVMRQLGVVADGGDRANLWMVGYRRW
jgi:hypothetical protein